MSEKNVCSSGWHGDHGTTITLKNENSNSVTVSPDATCSWPFSSPSSSFTVPAKVGSTPGTYQATLVNTPGSYCYDTSGCPSLKADTNPKTVIID